MSLTAISSLKSARRIFFMNSTYIMLLKTRNQPSLGSGGRNVSNSHQFARIGEYKNFHELDVHHVEKVGIKRFRALEAEMCLNRHQLARIGEKKIFINSTYIMSRK